MAVTYNVKGTSVSSFQIGKGGVTLTADAAGYLTIADGAATQQPLGFNTIPIYEIDVADTFDLAHAGMMWHKDSGAAVTFTCDNDATIPQGSTWVVHNDDTEDLTIAQGSGVTIALLASGAAPATGNVTVSQGGIVTVYKYTATEYWVWGDESPFDILTAGATTNSTLRWSGSAWSENTNVLLTSTGSLYTAELSAAAADSAGFGQIWVRDDAPNTLMFTDDAGNDNVVSGNTTEVDYNYSSAVTSTDPGAGSLNFNSVTIGSITTLYIDDLISTGQDYGWALSNLADGDVLTIRSATDPADYIVASINGAPTDSTDFWTISLTLIHTGTIFTNGDQVRISIEWLSQVSVGNASTITVADEAADTTSFPLFVTAATGDLAPKSNTGLTFNASTADLNSTLIAGIANASLVDKTAAETITGVWDFTTNPSQHRFGIGGDYSSTGAAATWGATVWSLDTTWKGATAGVDSASTSVYGVRWLRASHVEAHSQVDEGLYGYVNGVQEWGCGDGGIATFNGSRFSAYSVGNDKVVQIIHNDTDGVIAASSSGGLHFTTAVRYQFDDGILGLAGISAGGTLSDDGQVDAFAFMDISGGIARFGGWNYDTPAWQPVEVHGSAIEINSQTGPSIKLQAAGVDIVDINSSGKFDILGYDLQIRDAATLRVYDSTDSDFIEFAHDGTDANTTFANTTDWNIGNASLTRVAFAHGTAGAGIVDLLNGNQLRIWDSGSADRAAFDHDGTDFNTGFTNTADWNITDNVRVVFSASTTTRASLNIPDTGVAPTAPADGDMWVTTTDIFARINGVSTSLITGSIPTVITVADESADTTCFPAFFTAATGDLGPKTGSNLTFNSASGDLSATTVTATVTTGTAPLTITSITQVDNLNAEFHGGLTTGAFLRSDAADTKTTGDLTFNDNIALRFGTGGDIDISWDTVDLEITGLAANQIWNFRDGADIRVYDSADQDYIGIHHDGTNATINTAGISGGAIFLDPSSVVGIRSAAIFRQYDSDNNAWVDMQHDGTDFNISDGTGTTDINITGFVAIAAGTVDADFDAITATSYGGITEANLVDLSATEAITGTWTLDGSVTETDFGTGGKVKDGTDVSRPVGFNTIPVYEIDAADTFDLAHVGMLWHKDAGAAVTFTCNNDATIPQGASYMVHNDDTEDLTIAEGTATIEFLAPGAAPVGGNVTVEQGGIVTVYKYSDAIFWVWGAKAEATAANITVADESTDTTCFPIFTTAATGDLPPKSGSNLTFNSSTGNLSATSVGGILEADLIQSTGTPVDNQIAVWTNANTVEGDAALTFDGGNFRVYDSADTDYIELRHNGTNAVISTNVGTVIINDITDIVGKLSAPQLFLDEAASATTDVAGDGQVWVKTATPNNLYFTTDNGLDYPVGYGIYRLSATDTIDSKDVTETIGAQHINGVWHKTTTTARVLTLEASSGTNFPVGAQLTIYNRSTSGTMTVTDTATQTLWLLDGSTAVDSVGGVVIAAGGYATLIRESTTVSVIMGAGIT